MSSPRSPRSLGTSSNGASPPGSAIDAAPSTRTTDEEQLPPVLLGYRFSEEAQAAMQQGKLAEARAAHDNAKRAFKQAGDALAAANAADRDTRDALALLVEHHRLRARDLKQIIKQQQQSAVVTTASPPHGPQQKKTNTAPAVAPNAKSKPSQPSSNPPQQPASLSASFSELVLNNQTVKGAWREFSEMGNALISATAAQLQHQQQQLLQRTRSPSPPAPSSVSTSSSSTVLASSNVRRAAAMSASVSGTSTTGPSNGVNRSHHHYPQSQVSNNSNNGIPPRSSPTTASGPLSSTSSSSTNFAGANAMAQSYAGLGESFYLVPTDQQDNIGMFMRANAGGVGGRDSVGVLRTDNERLAREVESLREQLRREQERSRAQTRRFAAVFTALKLAVERAEGGGVSGGARSASTTTTATLGVFSLDEGRSSLGGRS